MKEQGSGKKEASKAGTFEGRNLRTHEGLRRRTVATQYLMGTRGERPEPELANFAISHAHAHAHADSHAHVRHIVTQSATSRLKLRQETSLDTKPGFLPQRH